MRVAREIGILSVAAMLLGSCAVANQQGESVRVVGGMGDVSGCKMLQEMEEYSGWGGLMANVGNQNNIASMRNKTAAMGGDTLLVLSQSNGFMASVNGQAYRCQP